MVSMRKFLFLLLLASSQPTFAQQPDFCGKLDKLISSIQNKDKSLWGEFVQGDSFTQSYKSKFSLAEGNTSNTTFYTVSDDDRSFGYREDIYKGADSTAGWKIYKELQSKLQKCIDFKLKESVADGYNCKFIPFFFGSYSAALEYCNEDAGRRVSVVFKITRVYPSN
jgi:hypothetical protein